MNESEEEELTLISHKLCPYVQRVVAALEETGRSYKRIDIEFNNKPEWFLKISPLGKVPVLVVNDEVILFESSVIGEYINDTSEVSLLPSEPLHRARQRAWIEFASANLNNISSLYNAKDELTFTQEKRVLMNRMSPSNFCHCLTLG